MRIKLQTFQKNWGSIFDEDKAEIVVANCENDLVPERALRAAQDYFKDEKRVLLHYEANDRELRQMIGDKYSVDPTNIFITAATLDGIQYVTNMFARPGVKGGVVSPDFPPYPAYLKRSGADLAILPSGGFPFYNSPAAVADFIRDEKVDLLFMSNPSVALGTKRSTQEIEEIVASTDAICLIDEADAVDHDSAAKLTERHENLIVLRSFSKWYGLADLRIGYLVCNPTLSQAFDDNLNVCGVTGPSIEAAKEAMKDEGYLQHVVDTFSRNRAVFEAKLKETKFKPVPDSQCFVGFIVAEDGSDVYRAFMDRGIKLNAGRNYGIEPFAGLESHPELMKGARINYTNTTLINKIIERI